MIWPEIRQGRRLRSKFPKKIKISSAIVTEFNTTNNATGYHSGAAINMDQSVHIAPFPKMPALRFALQGYWHQQIGKDTIDGLTVQDGFKGRAFALGPQVEYSFSKRAAVLFKYDREFGVQNRPRGNRFWFELTLPVF